MPGRSSGQADGPLGPDLRIGLCQAGRPGVLGERCPMASAAHGGLSDRMAGRGLEPATLTGTAE